VIAGVRRIARELDPQAGVHSVATMEELVANRLSRPRLYAAVLGLFTAVAAILTLAGLFGVVACAVAERTREIGIRMALGAHRSSVVILVLRQTLALTALGIVAGLSGAAGLTRYLEGLLFGLTPLDPATWVAAAALFAVTALAAAGLAARRAATVDPAVALRRE
jgi:ABC-type antimicrobial peptide transport system permease subunit